MEFPAIDPVALQLGPLAIRWYALAYLCGFLLGWVYALRLAQKVGAGRPHKEDIDDFLIWAIPGVILGGRIGYVLFYNLDFYIQNPFISFEIFGTDLYIPSALAVWQGGMSFHGGVIGVAIAMIAYAYKYKIPVLKLSDIICAAAPIGLLLGRIANFINAELYGRVTDVPWGVIFPGTDGQPRHPSQLYEAALEGAVIFIILFIMAKKGLHHRYPGILSAMFLMLYGIFRFIIEYVRAPDEQLGLFFNVISMGQILCLPMIALGLVIAIHSLRYKPHDVSK